MRGSLGAIGCCYGDKFQGTRRRSNKPLKSAFELELYASCLLFVRRMVGRLLFLLLFSNEGANMGWMKWFFASN